MRDVSRKHDVEQSAAAEKNIIEQVQVESKQYDTGLKLLRFVVKLTLEEDARNHIRQLKHIERTKVYERRQAELDKERIEFEVERTRMKMDFYSPLIKEGQWQLLALQLVSHPEDVASIAQMIHQQHQADMESQLKALKMMLEEDAIDAHGFQMAEASKRVLQRFVDSFGPDLGVKAIADEVKPKALETKQQSEDSKS